MSKKIRFSILGRLMMAVLNARIALYAFWYRKELAERLAKETARDARLQELHKASLRYRVAIGRAVSFRRCDGQSWRCRIVDVVPRHAGDVRFVLEAPDGVFNGLPILLFDAYMPWWEVWFRGEEDVSTVEVRFDWEDAWRADAMPALPTVVPSAVTHA